MMEKDPTGWYEAGLPARERKLRGHFSTPPQLVEQILDACGYTAQNDLSRLRVLDPACGSGNFLLGAARRLIAYGQQSGLTPKKSAALVQRNVWGLDPDPVACFLAEMQLRSILPPQRQPRRLHIHQADGLSLPWGEDTPVDLFLANPPYLAAKNNDLSVYRSLSQQGQSDSYLLFLNLALQAVRPDGWIGLVLPDPVLARANAARERQRLLAETTIHHLWHLANVFTAYVGAVVIIAQKRSPSTLHHISWQRERWQRSSETKQVAIPVQEQPGVAKTLAQALLSSQPGAELRYLLSDVQGTLITRLHTSLHSPHVNSVPHGLARLDQIVTVRRGEEIGKDSSLLCATPPRAAEAHAWYPVLRGGVDIQPYSQPDARCWIARAAITKSLKRYLAPKLLVIKSMGRLQAALDLKGHVVLQTLYLLQPHRRENAPTQKEDAATQEEDELYFLLALLNSRLLQEYVYVLYTAYKWVQPQIEQHVLAGLPIPTRASARQKAQIIARARIIVNACSLAAPVVELKAQLSELYEEQERAIRALYEVALQYGQAAVTIGTTGSTTINNTIS